MGEEAFILDSQKHEGVTILVFLLDMDGYDICVDVIVDSAFASLARAGMDDDGSIGGWKRSPWMALMEERAKLRAVAAASPPLPAEKASA